jgi:hypothetical protein
VERRTVTRCLTRLDDDGRRFEIAGRCKWTWRCWSCDPFPGQGVDRDRDQTCRRSRTGLKDALDNQARERQETFAEALDRQRAEAAKALEQFKAELSGDADKRRHEAQEAIEALRTQLTFESEVRRQAAGYKVDLALKIVAATNTAIETFVALDKTNEQRLQALHTWWLPAREADVLFNSGTLAHLEMFSGTLVTSNQVIGAAELKASSSRDPSDSFERVKAYGSTHEAILKARRTLFEGLRHELHTVEARRLEVRT